MTNLLRWTACWLLWGVVAVGQNAPSVIVIRAGTLIDGKSDKPRSNQIIVIRGNRIESVSAEASARTPAGAKVIDLA
jgi:imidazolonepropionase-like amidohydrolase